MYPKVPGEGLLGSTYTKTGKVLLRYLLRASPNGQVWHKAFFGGSGRPAFPKNAYGRVGIPLIRWASGAGRWTQPPRRVSKPGGGRPPEAEGNYPATKTHSARSVPAASTAGRNATQQLEKHSVNTAAAAQFICRCLPLDTTWHMVISPKAD